MNHTLTGLGIALLVALAAALIGPFFIDWGNHRAAFEAQASRIVGVPVRVLGEVDARLLPSPRIRFSKVVAGDEWAASKFTADSFELDIALMPLLRGEYQVSMLRVDGADLKASLSADGEISLPIAPGGVRQESLDAIEITDFDLTRSRVTIADPAAGRSTVIDHVALQGEAASLAGPLKFDARGKVGDRAYTLRAATGRFDRAGLGKVTLALSSADAPTLSLEGTLLLGAKPRFDGVGSIVQAAAAKGEPPREPWRIAGALKADSRRLDADKVDFDYGSAGHELRLAGGIGLVFGPKPSAEIRLEDRQIDLDRALGQAKDAPSRPPAEVLAALAGRFPWAASPSMPLRVTADVEGVSLGGDLVQNVKAAVASEPGGWTIENFSARLPGGAALDASGALSAREGEGPRFSGPVKLDAPNVPSLLHWIEGLGGSRPAIALKSLKLDATLAARPDAYALEDMTASADGGAIKGRLAFTGAQEGRNKLEARLTADALDLDALDPLRLFAFAKSGNAAGTDTDVTLRAKKLTYAKVVWSGVDVDLTAASGGIDIRRLAIADLGGARIAATGRLAAGEGQPAGHLEARIEAAGLNGLVSVLRTSSLPPAFIDVLGTRAAAIAPAVLNAVVDSTPGGVTAKVEGSLGGTMVSLQGRAPKLAFEGALKADLTASATDGARLFRQLGLPAIAVENFGAADLKASIDGDPADGAKVAAEMSSGADRLNFTGKTDAQADKTLVGRVDLNLEDAGRYAALFGRAPPASLPTISLTIGGDVGYGDKGLQIGRIAGTVQGRALKGDLRYGGKQGLRGEVDISSLTLSELAGIALGPLALNDADAAGWPAGTFGPGLLDGLEGRIAVRTDAFEIVPGLVGKTKFNLALGRSEFAVQDAETALGGGMLKSNMAVRRSNADVSLAVRLAVEGVGLANFVWGGHTGPAATGSLDLTADMLGTGQSLSGVVSALTGSGSFTLRDAKLGGVDAGAFERTMIAVEGGTEPPDAAEIARRFGDELAMADLEVSEISSAFTIASGVARVSNAAISAPLVNATASGAVDIPHKTFQAVLTLRPKILAELSETATPHADLSLAGPWTAPARSAETTEFANVLAARAVEREIERVEKMEAERRERERKAAEDEARRVADEAEAARVRAIREATGDIPMDALPPPVDVMPKAAKDSPRPATRSPSGAQGPLDFLRRPVVPEASR